MSGSSSSSAGNVKTSSPISAPTPIFPSRKSAFEVPRKKKRARTDESPKESLAATNIASPSVFLGGACNPTTWRRDVAIPALNRAGITYYNPQVDDWKPELMELEARAKERASWLLFVITDATRGIASMVEAAELVADPKISHRVVLVVRDVKAAAAAGNDGSSPPEGFAPEEAKDINRGRAYLRELCARKGVRVHASLDDALERIAQASKISANASIV